MEESMTPPPKRPLEEEDEEMAAKKQKLSATDFVPRSYQVMVFEEALRGNTIAVLDMGAGKTMIAVMLIKDMVKGIEANDQRRLIVFLAPTVQLVQQQYDVVNTYPELKAMQFYGEMKVDQWNVEVWEKEICDHQVLVMTPQILLDALRKAFLTIDMVRLLIFDECHHAAGHHPYTKIMKEFYHKPGQRPKFFGMMSSRLTKKGVSSLTDCEVQLAELESILDSKMYILGDRSLMNHCVPAAKEVNKYYDRMLFPYHDLKTHLGALLAKCDTSLAQPGTLPLCMFQDAQDMLNKSRKDCLNWHATIHHCLDDLGLICANEAAKLCLESIHRTYPAHSYDYFAECISLCTSFHEEVIRAVEYNLPRGYENLLHTKEGCREAIKYGYISPKLFELLQLLIAFKPNQVRCLIFVERIITARVIERILKKTSYLSHINVAFLTGGSHSSEAISSKRQRQTLELFRHGKVNILFTTNVAEEGIDIPECSCVICFDLPRTVCSYVQSRGRARQAGSLYIVMLERGNVQQRDLLFNIIRSKHSMMDTAQNRDAISLIQKMFNNEEPESFKVESTGATITVDSCVSLVHKYCDKLPKDKYYTPRPLFEFNSDGSCTLTLPPSSAFQKLVGPSGHGNHKAKQLVCLEACKKLHETGALDDHLLPIVEEPMEIELCKEYEKSTGAGTTKRKELHKTVTVSALSGTWVHQKNSVNLQGYKLNFLCNKIDQKYSSFILLIDTVLDKDAGSLIVDLYLNDKMVKAHVSPCGPIQLEADQIEKAKKFQELFFNGAFGRLFRGAKTSGEPRQFLLDENSNSFWKESYIYFLLPLEFPCFEEDNVKINWKGINDSYSVIDLLRRGYKPDGNCSSSNGGDASMVSENKSEPIRLLNKTVNIQNIKGMVVMAVHTGKLYSVLKAVEGTSANSPFETSDVGSFSEYFIQKYDIELQHPEQPLLLLKQSHNPHNLLSSKFNYEAQSKSKKKGSCMYVKKPLNNVHMPPELLIHIGLPVDVMKSLYLLPSLMHRMESLMLASQLRREISSESSDFCIPITLLLEAITTLRCSEDFSLERLELLGDSVLKYVLSCYLYMKYPEKHEGQLSSRRSHAVCNAMLHKLGIDRNIQGYIRDCAFDPRRWIAPGQFTNRPSPCTCAISEKPFEILHANDSSVVIGKTCDDGHRWICSKTISDCVEALIGACYVGGGLSASISVIKWLGIDVNIDTEMVEKYMMSMNSKSFVSKPYEIFALESKIGYQFTTKDLLLEAITHTSHQINGTNYCYQRLEFLGDAALDMLITWHLFNTYTDIDPGELTDLRSASVNNETFARCAVKHTIQQHLQHASALLIEQITEYVERLKQAGDNEDMPSLNNSSKGPKVLGDMVESIAGAILVDTKLNLNKVWEIFEPLLSPIVTPGKLELPPVRELVELVSHAGYFLNTEFRMEGEFAVAKLSVQLEKVYLMREGRDKKKKVAKGQAAFLLLKDLEKQGITRFCDPSYLHEEYSADNSCLGTNVGTDTTPMDADLDESRVACKVNLGKQVSVTVSMKKGGPRTALSELCQKSQWPMPRFDSVDYKLSAEEAEAKGITGKNGLLHFLSSVTVHIPDYKCLKLEGETRPDKKSSQDSAALVMLSELQKQGRCQLTMVQVEHSVN